VPRQSEQFGFFSGSPPQRGRRSSRWDFHEDRSSFSGRPCSQTKYETGNGQHDAHDAPAILERLIRLASCWKGHLASIFRQFDGFGSEKSRMERRKLVECPSGRRGFRQDVDLPVLAVEFFRSRPDLAEIVRLGEIAARPAEQIAFFRRLRRAAFQLDGVEIFSELVIQDGFSISKGPVRRASRGCP
jgi:hypothetical protein